MTSPILSRRVFSSLSQLLHTQACTQEEQVPLARDWKKIFLDRVQKTDRTPSTLKKRRIRFFYSEYLQALFLKCAKCKSNEEEKKILSSSSFFLSFQLEL